MIKRIQALEGEYHFETYVSLSCHNCPDVVQALNMMSVLNPGITHTMIDGAAFRDEVESKEIMAVPTVYLNGEFFESGRMTVEDILNKLGSFRQAPKSSRTKTLTMYSSSAAARRVRAQRSMRRARGSAPVW